MALLALALLPSSARAAEPYEGAWVTSTKECSDKDGPTSLTVIDLNVNIDGKPRAMVEQYENHCFIDSKSTAGSDTTLKATCYEFWDDHKKKVNGTKETIKLSLVSKEQLKIDGKISPLPRERGRRRTKAKRRDSRPCGSPALAKCTAHAVEPVPALALAPQRRHHQERDHPEDHVDQREHDQRVVAVGVVVDQAAAP